MKLTDLNPRFLDAGPSNAPTARGAYVEMDCPCGECGDRLLVPFSVCLDGSPGHSNGWERTGDTFETLTLRPSILRPRPYHCGWHGYMTAGQVTSC